MARQKALEHFAHFGAVEKKPGIQLQLATTCCRHKDSLDSETLVPYQCVLKREDDLVAIRRFVCLPILTPSLAYFGPNHIPEGHHRYSNDHSRFIANKTVVIMVIITILSAYFWYHRILSSCFTHGTPTHGASITAGARVPEQSVVCQRQDWELVHARFHEAWAGYQMEVDSQQLHFFFERQRLPKVTRKSVMM